MAAAATVTAWMDAGGSVAEQDPTVLVYEQDVNTAYVANLERRSKGYEIDGVFWRPDIRPGALIGRVRMRCEGDDADDEFYIGETVAHLEGPEDTEIEVVSWAAPAAAAFYGKRFGGAESRVKVRRHFTEAAGRQVADYADEWVTSPDGLPFTTPAPVPGPATEPVPQDPATQADHQASATEAELRKPRTPLKALLRTLAPEQYDLVAASASDSMVVQGYAGTGKTVVATHRAAWLTHTERDRPLQRILLVGPTPTWGHHIRPVIDELTAPGTVSITSLPELMRSLIGAPDLLVHDGDFIDASSEPLGRTVAALVDEQRLADPDLTAARAYEVFLHTNKLSIPRSRLGEFREWRETLPPTHEAALGERQLWPLLAYLAVLLDPPERYDHVVVDEAQDLRPLEWMILKHLNAGSWTLVGDNNQRRTSHTPRRWSDIRKLLGLAAWNEESLHGGYRTTKAIIDFAACLLPKGQGHRRYDVLGEGTPPRILDVRQQGSSIGAVSIEAAALEEVVRLAEARPKGSVAIISALVRELGSYAKRHGWTEGADHYWTDGNGHRFTLLTSPEARGLEFDAVVVVEPAAFRALAGDNGPLYTAMTRANLELVIVHERSLTPPMVLHLRTRPPDR